MRPARSINAVTAGNGQNVRGDFLRGEIVGRNGMIRRRLVFGRPFGQDVLDFLNERLPRGERRALRVIGDPG